jgi:hypothetical protein
VGLERAPLSLVSTTEELQTAYNFNYTPTILGVQSWGMRTKKKVEYSWCSTLHGVFLCIYVVIYGKFMETWRWQILQAINVIMVHDTLNRKSVTEVSIHNDKTNRNVNTWILPKKLWSRLYDIQLRSLKLLLNFWTWNVKLQACICRLELTFSHFAQKN